MILIIAGETQARHRVVVIYKEQRVRRDQIIRSMHLSLAKTDLLTSAVLPPIMLIFLDLRHLEG